jgi:type IX secretion system PorP/SprF family membrane protein
MKKIIAILTMILVLSEMKAQQDPQFTHYMYNTISVNPGYAGSRGNLTIGGLYRNQWIGLAGAPTTQTVYLHSPIFNENNGAGLSIVNDRIGPINQTFAYADYAYHIRLAAKVKLALGLKAGFNFFQPNGIKDLTTTDPKSANTIADATVQNVIAPNFGTGAYLYGERFYVGVSVPRFIKSKLPTYKVGPTGVVKEITETRHIFTILGFVLPLNETIKLKPTFLSKITQNSPMSIDATAEFLFNDKFSLGAGYRHTDALCALVGFNFSPQLKAGISYDYNLSKLNRYNSGSIEAMLQYDLFRKVDKVKSPRYF